MRTREALLPDAEQIHELIAAYSGRRNSAAAHLRRSLRERARLRGARRSRPHHRLRRAAPLRPAPGRNSLHHRRSRAPGLGRRRASGEGAAGAGPEAQGQLASACLPAIPEFFARLGFAMAQREDLPDKIHKDCCVCPRFHYCDEVAMVRGELPKFAMLPEPANWLVKIEV